MRAGGSSWVRLETGWRVSGWWDGMGAGTRGWELVRWVWGWWKEVGRFWVSGMGWGLAGWDGCWWDGLGADGSGWMLVGTNWMGQRLVGGVKG